MKDFLKVCALFGIASAILWGLIWLIYFAFGTTIPLYSLFVVLAVVLALVALSKGMQWLAERFF